jgi:hypothetical protein
MIKISVAALNAELMNTQRSELHNDNVKSSLLDYASIS